MSNNLPTTTPAETLVISPESLEVANAYLQCPDMAKVADSLDMPVDVISNILDRREVKAYINNVFFNTGFNNRFQVRDLMDAIIKKKLAEMDDADIGSTKDITEIMALSHKITMETLDKEIQLEKIRAAAQIKTQTNIQINDSGGSKYASLIEQLVRGNTIDAND